MNRLSTAAVAAALILGATAPLHAAPVGSDPATEHDQCVADAEKEPAQALARAKQWSNQGGGFDADHCAAMALFGLKQYREAAEAFERLGHTMANAAPAVRARLYAQAGQTWLLAENAAQARRDLDTAIEFAPGDPDLYIDRSEASAAQAKYWDAIDDLNRASDLAPGRADIFVYRAAAYRAVDSIDLAREDIERNLRLAPNNPIGLLERGNIRRLAGDVTGAKQDWQAVVKLAPGSASAKAAGQNLARLGATRDKPSTPPKTNGPS